MGLFTLGLQQQKQAVSAGINAYPKIGQMVQDNKIEDVFDRATLNPTGGFTFYAVSSPVHIISKRLIPVATAIEVSVCVWSVPSSDSNE